MASRHFILAAALFGSMALVGCTSKGGDEAGEELSAVADAARAARREDSARFSTIVTEKKLDTGEAFVRRYEGEIDPGSVARFDVDYYGTKLTGWASGEDVIAVDEDGEVVETSIGSPEVVGNPADLATALRSAKTTDGPDSSEEIHGSESKRYTATIRPDRVLAEAQVHVNAKTDDLPDDLEMEVWVNSDGLPARVAFELELNGSDLHLAVVTEFWDWGTAEAPSNEDAMTALLGPFLTGLSTDLEDFANPFEGATCYGARVAECLGPNPEVQAMAQDPSLCTGAEAHVCLVPFGNVRKDIIDAIVAFHRETRGLDIVVLPSEAVLPEWVDAETSQVTEYALQRVFKARYGVRPETPSTFIAITPYDMRPESDEYGWFFGARFTRGASPQRDGVFSYFRMQHVQPYDGSQLTDELLHTRVSKYVGRYVSLLFDQVLMGDDISLLNYHSMYGFSDLDGLGTTWPDISKFTPPCRGERPTICLVPDLFYEDPKFESALDAAITRLDSYVAIDIEVFKEGGFYPSRESWSEEFRNDLTRYIRLRVNAEATLIGITDDAFAQDSSIEEHMEAAWPGERLAVVSGSDLGRPGTPELEERLFRLLLRAVAQTAYGMPLNDDPSSLLYRGIATPEDLDEKELPDLTQTR